MRTTWLLMALLSMAACQPQSGESARVPPGSSAVATSELATVRAEIDRVREVWTEAAERDDAETIAELYAENGAIIDPMEYVPVQGREAIRKVLATELPMVGRLELRSQDFHASGDLAYDYGEFTEQVTPPGQESMTIRGRYLLILRRQEDGAWRLVKKIAMLSPRQLTQN